MSPPSSACPPQKPWRKLGEMAKGTGGWEATHTPQVTRMRLESLLRAVVVICITEWLVWREPATLSGSKEHQALNSGSRGRIRAYIKDLTEQPAGGLYSNTELSPLLFDCIFHPPLAPPPDSMPSPSTLCISFLFGPACLTGHHKICTEKPFWSYR